MATFMNQGYPNSKYSTPQPVYVVIKFGESGEEVLTVSIHKEVAEKVYKNTVGSCKIFCTHLS